MEAILLIVGIGVFLYSVIIHEISHGLMAESMGDRTARDAGRITLNPIPHLDMIGSVFLPLILILSGSPFVFGYAKPVPYNPHNLNDRRYGPLKVSLAGPFSNLLLALLFGLTLRFLPAGLGGEFLPLMLAYVVHINLGLLLLNLVPIPPLDGHQILFTLLPERFYEVKYFLMRYGFVFLMLFVVFGFRYLSPLIRFLFSVIVGS